MIKCFKITLISILIYLFSLHNFGVLFLTSDSVEANPAVGSTEIVDTLNGKIQNFEQGKKPQVKPDELIIKYKSNAKDKNLTNKKVQATVIENNARLGVNRVKLPKGISLVEVIKEYESDPNVEYAHPNYIYEMSVVPNDPGYLDQWHLPNIQAKNAWDITMGSSSVIVAIVDTGVDLNHPDLKNNIISGYNFVSNNNNPQDDEGHGTHVAGITAAVTNNGIGVAGLAGSVKIMPIKVLDSTGSGYTTDIAEGIRYAADNGADIINLSLGGAGTSQTLEDAVNYATQQGSIVIAAAGNDGLASVSYPAKYSNAVAVSATDQNNVLASFSNYGPEIEVSAPGVDILSTFWNSQSNYAYLSGTSMATPLVAGQAALILSINSKLSNSEVRGILKNTADDLGVNGFDNKYGHGKINAFKASTEAVATLSPITTLTTNPISSDGEGEWFKTRPEVILASDEPGTTYYSWNSSTGPWITYTGSFPVPDGVQSLYYYSVDTNGYTEEVKSQIIKVDTEQPTVPQLSAKAIGGTEVELSWTVSTDGISGVNEYQIFDAETNSLVARTQTVSYFHSGLTEEQTYSYYIKVVDMAGNISAQTNTETVTLPKELSGAILGGTKIEVNLGGGIRFVFDQVTNGQISVLEKPSEKGSPLGFRLVRGSSYDITTTEEATYSGSIRITLPYNAEDIVGPEKNLKLFHWENSVWTDITESVDTSNNTITGITTSFSPFAVAESEGASPAVGGVAGLPEIFVIK